MAAIEPIKNGKDYDDILNVGLKVGTGCPNVLDDVMVVQALLNYIRHFYNFAPQEPALVTPATGNPEPHLSRVIKAYQKNHNRNPNNRGKLTEDGIVGRAKGTTGWATHKTWTIVALNYECEIFYLARTDAKSDSMINDVLARNPLLNPMIKFGSVLQF